MTRNITLLNSNEIGGLQKGKSDSLFHLFQTAVNRLFLCLFVNFLYYLTLNQNQRCLFHLKTVA